MFSKSCEYAIKALIFVARKSKEGLKVGVKVIAESTDAPEHYVAKIMQELAKKRLILSAKGPNGGFYMSEKELNIPLAEVVKAIDGDKLYVDCALGLKDCSETNPCPIHFEYKEIKKRIIHMLESNTFNTFNLRLDSGKFFLRNS